MKESLKALEILISATPIRYCQSYNTEREGEKGKETERGREKETERDRGGERERERASEREREV